MRIRLRRFAKSRVKLRDHFRLPRLIALKIMPNWWRFALIILAGIRHTSFKQKHYEFEFAQEWLFFWYGLSLLNFFDCFLQVKFSFNFGKDLGQHWKQLRYPVNMHGLWKLPIWYLILFSLKIIILQNALKRRNESFQN